MKKILFLLITSLTGYSQTSLKGIISDSKDKSPVKYANIFIKNKNKGTISDRSGNFTIDFDKSKDTLIFSCVGYKKIEVSGLNKSFVDISMQKDTLRLSEISIKPIIKNCKKYKIKYNKPKYDHYILIEGSTMRRKIKINSKYLCGFGFEVYSNYDTNIVIRPYLTNSNFEPIIFNDYVTETKVMKHKLTHINFNFKENILLENEPYYIGLEVLSIANTNNYGNYVQIKCSNDVDLTSDNLYDENFTQQNGIKIKNGIKLDQNIKINLITSE